MRRVYEKSSTEIEENNRDRSGVDSKERAIRQALLNSRNPKADINNPNNPIYKGRPGNRDIESYLESAKGKPDKEKLAERRVDRDRDSGRGHDDSSGKDPEFSNTTYLVWS